MDFTGVSTEFKSSFTSIAALKIGGNKLFSVTNRNSPSFSSSGVGRSFVHGDLRTQRVLLTGVNGCLVELRTQHQLRVQEVDCRRSERFCAFESGSRPGDWRDDPTRGYRPTRCYVRLSKADYEEQWSVPGPVDLGRHVSQRL